MILSNILYRTFFIKAMQYGSAFTVDVDGEEYIVTARHLLDLSQKQIQLQLFHSEQWHTLNATVIGHGRGEIDISVLKVSQRLSHEDMTINLTIAEMCLGQDIYFLGFPYKMWSNVGSLLGGMPCAFAKKGTVSAFQLNDPQILHIDAFNNEGFSGGPLFFCPHGQLDKVHVVGVVSKFKIEQETVIDENGDKTNMSVPYNTGFMVAYGTKYILSIIESYRQLPK